MARLSSPKSALGARPRRFRSFQTSLPHTERKALFEVAHYNRKYKSPASGGEGDIGYEFGATKTSDRALVQAIERGEHRADESLERLIRRGLVKRIHGGYEVTRKGKTALGPGWIRESDEKWKRDYALAK